MKPISIFIAHADNATRKILVATVEKIGHHIMGTAADTAALISTCTSAPPDLIISGSKFPDGDGIGALIKISEHQRLPAIVVAKKEHQGDVEKAMRDHVFAYLIDPVTADDLEPTILVVLRRFEEFEQLKSENENLRLALDTRKKLERAKGILMAAGSLTEEQAYLKIRDKATSQRIKLGQASQQVIDALNTKNT